MACVLGELRLAQQLLVISETAEPSAEAALTPTGERLPPLALELGATGSRR
jgi:hypothetical protein